MVFGVTDYGDFKSGHERLSEKPDHCFGQLTRPAWWDSWPESNGLGSWSEKKYTLFMEQIHVIDLTLDGMAER